MCGFSFTFYSHFERSYDVSKSKSPYILSNKNINFNKNGTESKMENPTCSFRETNIVLQLIKESQIKSKKKKEGFFCTLYFVQRNFLTFVTRYFLLVNCYFLLVTRYYLLLPRYFLLVTPYFSFVYSSLITCYSLLYFSFVTTYSLLITFYSLFLLINCYFLLVKLWKPSDVKNLNIS